MRNRILLSFSIILVALTASGCSLKNVVTSENCADCGKDGWQKMDVSCGQEIFNTNDFKKCLTNFSWSSVNDETSLENVKEGYIKISGKETLNNPVGNSIKVYIFNQWSVDKDGNLYLLGQLG